MGKVEKVIVLSVLFVIALILVVSVTVDDPLDKTKVADVGGKPAPAVAQAQVQPAGPAVLSTQVQPTAGAALADPGKAVQPAPAAPSVAPAPSATSPAASGLPSGTLLKRSDGLTDSMMPNMKLYTWKEGDNWRRLANDYYGDWRCAEVLKRNNEGRMDVQPGETVFVPVFADDRAYSAAPAPEPAKDDTAAQSGKKKSDKGAVAAKAEPKSGGKLHVVKAGESLWKIAKAELGDGNRWKEIYEANREVLSSPEAIQKGMRLRIP